MGYQRGSFALGYVDDLRDPLDWLYDRPSVPKDFYTNRRTACWLLRETAVTTPSPE